MAVVCSDQAFRKGAGGLAHHIQCIFAATFLAAIQVLWGSNRRPSRLGVESFRRGWVWGASGWSVGRRRGCQGRISRSSLPPSPDLAKVSAEILRRQGLDVQILELFLCKSFAITSHLDRLMRWLDGAFAGEIRPPSSYGSFGTLSDLCDKLAVQKQLHETVLKGEQLWQSFFSEDLRACETQYFVRLYRNNPKPHTLNSRQREANVCFETLVFRSAFAGLSSHPQDDGRRQPT